MTQQTVKKYFRSGSRPGFGTSRPGFGTKPLKLRNWGCRGPTLNSIDGYYSMLLKKILQNFEQQCYGSGQKAFEEKQLS